MKNKKSNFSEWYTELTKEAKLCDLRYNVKGFIVFMPNAVITMKEMYRAYEKELERRGHRPALFPAVIPESNFKIESEHVEGFVPQVFWITKAGVSELDEKLAMRPTSETAIYKMYSLWIRGIKDLPMKLYQSCQVWRHETKATRPFIRSREFYWIEAHDAFATKGDALRQVREDMEITEEVMHKKFGIPFIFFKRPQWDKFPGAVDTFAADTLMPDGRAIQQPSTHFLGQNFSKAFNITYLNERGERSYVWQTCYGPAISRIYASLISIHGDDRGLVLPFDLSPTQIVIIPIISKGIEDKVLRKCRELYAGLKDRYRTVLDDSDNTPGFKFNQWELLGAAVRIEVGEREVDTGELTVVRRDELKREKVVEKDLMEWIEKTRSNMLKKLRDKADLWFRGRIRKANSMEELGKALDNGGFVAVDFCSIGMDGKHCADKIKETFHGDVRGTRFDVEERPAEGARCVVCGRPAKHIVYVAKQY